MGDHFISRLECVTCRTGEVLRFVDLLVPLYPLRVINKLSSGSYPCSAFPSRRSISYLSRKTLPAVRQHLFRHAMHLPLSFWCVILSFAQAQQDSSESTSASASPNIPWITHTSTRSCTARPSTVFVYTSNSTTFLLPQPGPNSAITPLDKSTSTSNLQPPNTLASGLDSGGVPSNFGNPAHLSSKPPDNASSYSGNPGGDDLATPSTTSSTLPGASSRVATITNGQYDPSYSTRPTTTTSGSGAAFSAGSGPRSGTQAGSSSTLAAAGPTCPLPSTITVSAVPFSDACSSMAGKTVTSYIMASCPVPGGALEITQTVFQSGRTAYITRTRQRTRPIVVTYTSVESGTTVLRTSLQEQTIAPSSGPDVVVYTTLEVYRSSSPERTVTQSVLATPDGDVSKSCNSVTERTVTIERTVERTVPSFVPAPTSIQNGPPSQMTVTYTRLQVGYHTSVVERTAQPIVVTYTELQEASTSYSISTVQQPPIYITATYSEVLEGSTVYSVSISTTTPEPLAMTFTSILEASTIYRSSVVQMSQEVMTITYTDSQIAYSTSYIDQPPDPEVVSQSFAESGQTSYRTSLVDETTDSVASAEPTPASAFSLPASTIYSCIPGSETPLGPANASIQTVTSIMYETLNISECSASIGASTVTSFIYGLDTSSFVGTAAISPDPITFTGSTIYRTSVIERTVTASQDTFFGGSALATQTVTSFIYGQSMTSGNSDGLIIASTTFYVTETSFGNCSINSTDSLSVQTVTSIVFPSSCDYQYTTRDAPEITVTRRGSTVTVYASRTRTIVAYSTVITTATAPGNASQTDESEPIPDPDENPSDEDDFPEDEPTGTAASTSNDASRTSSIEGPAASSTEPQVSPTPVVANATDLAQQGTASDPYVVAQVVSPEDQPPITPPASNSSFLLVTFGSTNASSTTAASSTGGLSKRQASQQPLTYNATTYFSSVAGGIYNLSASAAMAQNGDTPPSCILSICVGTFCSPSYPLSTSFTAYTHTYNSPTTSNSQAGIFSIQCAGQAYVGLDNVRVDPIFVPQPTPSPASSTPSAGLTSSDAAAATSGAPSVARTSSSYARASIRTVTTSIYSVITTTAYATQTLTQTESTQILVTLTSRQVEPTTIVTTQLETATSLQNVTISDVQTLTSKYLRLMTFYHQLPREDLFCVLLRATNISSRITLQPRYCVCHRHQLLIYESLAADEILLTDCLRSYCYNHHSLAADRHGFVLHNSLPNSHSDFKRASDIYDIQPT